VGSEEQIDDHFDICTHSIKMSFESVPSVHLDQFEEFEEEKQVEEVMQVYEARCFDDDPLCLDKSFEDDLVTRTPPVEQIKSCCEDGCDDDESWLLDTI